MEYAYPYFYLSWNPKDPEPIHQATWYREIPTGYPVAWKKTIRVGYRDICLCCSHNPPDSPTVGMFSGTVYDSFLKSHLQKAVRRKNARAAIYTADLLLEMSPIQLLRRLPIIVVEDSFLHEGFSTLIWMMCAVSSCAKVGQNLFYLHEVQKRWVLGFVYQLVSVEFKEVAPDSCYSKKVVFNKSLGRIHALPPKVRDLVYALETRKVYGGMKGDEAMLSAFQNHYIDRFARDESNGWDPEGLWKRSFYSPIRPVLCKRTPFGQNEWIYAGYDFHCSPNILTRLEEEYPDFEKEEFKACIWYCSSGRNYHRSVSFKGRKYVSVVDESVPRHLTDLWKKIRKFVRGKAWGYVNRMLEELNSLYPEWIPYTEPAPREPESQTNTGTTQDEEDHEEYECDEEERQYIVSHS